MRVHKEKFSKQLKRVAMDGTIKKPVTVEYKKKRRNPRCYRVWESNILNKTLVLAHELTAKLEEIADAENLNMEDMQPSKLSSESLYTLATSYIDIYNAILKEGLVRTANPLTHPNIH